MHQDVPALPYRLAAVDIDDTLTGPDKRIGHANQAAVRRLLDAGVRVVLASGRRHANMVRFAETLGLTDFVISAQGAMAKHPATSEVIHYEPLARPLADEVIAHGLSLGLGLVAFTPEGSFGCRPTAWTEKLKRDTGGDLIYVPHLPPPQTTAVEKVLWCGEPGRLLAMFDDVTAHYAACPNGEFDDARADAGGPRAIVTITDPHLMEFTSPRATKATGLAAVADHYGIAREQVLAFGDGNNDVPMLGWAGLGVAMSHASPNAKRAAGAVAPAGDPETSLARAVEAVLSGDYAG
jgi:Cof subfamily protein (haloacid dehalogenase superfamily)